MLLFQEFASVNVARSQRWHPGGLAEWSAADWSNAMAGEAGEVCNAVKKLRRLETGVFTSSKGPQTRDAALAHIAKEIGDTVAYLDLLAQSLGLSLEDCTRMAFNEVSSRENFPERV